MAEWPGEVGVTFHLAFLMEGNECVAWYVNGVKQDNPGKEKAA